MTVELTVRVANEKTKMEKRIRVGGGLDPFKMGLMWVLTTRHVASMLDS